LRYSLKVKFISVKHVGIIKRHVVAIASEHEPLAVVHVSRVTITTRRLLARIDPNLDTGWITHVTRDALRGEMEVSCSSKLAGRTVRALSLLHHIVVLVEASISILNDKCILQLNGCRCKQTLTRLVLFSCLIDL
jgi:hypothetical protein